VVISFCEQVPRCIAAKNKLFMGETIHIQAEKVFDLENYSIFAAQKHL
jgi:hypothetical protein